MSYDYYNIFEELRTEKNDVFDALPMFKARFGSLINNNIFAIFCNYEKFFFCSQDLSQSFEKLHDFENSFGGFYLTSFNHIEIETITTEITLKDFMIPEFSNALIMNVSKRNILEFIVDFDRHVQYFSPMALMKAKVFGDHIAPYQLYTNVALLEEKIKTIQDLI
jgi:hypothetical protein